MSRILVIGAGKSTSMLIDDLLEASASFTEALLPFVTGIARESYAASFEQSELPAPAAAASVLWRAELAPAYRYLEAHLGQ